MRTSLWPTPVTLSPVILGIGIVLGMMLTACQSNPATHVRAQSLMAQIDAGDAPLIIDVRTEREYRNGHVPGAVHIPFYSVWSKLDAVATDATQPIVLYCAHGPRAGIAKLGGKLAGYESVKTLSGHMSGWRRSGLPIETDAAPDG